jgi:signal transduction histidine kinase
MGIEMRITLSFCLIIVTLMATIIYWVDDRQSSTLLEQTERRGTAVAQSIASVVKTSLLSYDFVSLQQAAETSADGSDVLYVIILTKEDVVAAYSGRPYMQGRHLTDPVSQRAVTIDAPRVQRMDDTFTGLVGVPHLDIAVPVHVDGTPVQWGTVRIGVSLAELHETMAQTRKTLLGLGLVAVVMVLLVAKVLSRRVSGPLENLARATAAVARGDLDQSVNENLVGELGDLARGFNQMTADLKQSQDAIKYQNQHLENIVGLRTAALHEKATQLEQAYEELKELDRLKGDFLSNVSHELRTPLTSIRSFTELLLEQSEDFSQKERTEFMEIISEQAQRLTRLISDLLDLSKMEAGKFSCDLEPVNVSGVVRSCVDQIGALAEERKLRLEVAVSDDVPAALADADRLNQVITNLLSNAIKFTEPGGEVTVRVERSQKRHRPLGAQRHTRVWTSEFVGMCSASPEQGEYVLVSVRDTGTGIPLEEQQRVFDKFGQVGNILTDKPQGTGLGLAISGSIAVQHEGALWVESAPGVGSVFGLSLPAVLQQAATHDADGRSGRRGVQIDAAQKDLVAALNRSAQGKRLLVVDDEPVIILALKELLTPLGYDVVACNTGSQAVSQARTLKPDAIILDIMMPELDGYDVLRLLKGDPQTAWIPVIVLSVLEDKKKAMSLGAAEYVRKPFNNLEIEERLRELV